MIYYVPNTSQRARWKEGERPSADASLYQYQVSVVMPARSLIIVQGAARSASSMRSLRSSVVNLWIVSRRNTWLHAVRREHVVSRRIASTLRELGPEFIGDGIHAGVGRDIIALAQTFAGSAVS